jgi:hypothetical protein
MTRSAAPLLLGLAAAAQAQTAPPLPAVPRETPENTGPLLSPATPGVNLDAPPEETPGFGALGMPVLVPPEPSETLDPPTPLDEQNALVFDGPVEQVSVDN